MSLLTCVLYLNNPLSYTSITCYFLHRADVFKHAFAREIWGNRALPRIHVYGFSKASNPEAEYSDVSSPFRCNFSTS